MKKACTKQKKTLRGQRNMYSKCSHILRAIFIWGTRAITPSVTLWLAKPNQSADTVIEKLVTEAREAGRSVSLVTSDKDVRSTVGFGPGEVTRISSAALVRDVEVSDTAIDDLQRETGRTRMTLEDRLSPEQRQRLWNLLDQ